MIGIVPAAGAGQRIQPLGCSKELLPVGTRVIDGAERPKAVSEYLIERMIAAGATEICIVISAEKSDIVRYYAEHAFDAEIFYVVQPRPKGLCDALFCATPFAAKHEQVLIGLPDTIWFPQDAFLPALRLGRAEVNLVLFPSDNPSAFDAVLCDKRGCVTEIQVKKAAPASNWIWGAVTTEGATFLRLNRLWEARQRRDEYLGDLLNAFLGAGHTAQGLRCGSVYLDVGTWEGYRLAQEFLRRERARSSLRAA